MVVVLVIIGIIAAMVVPRMTGMERRNFQQKVDQVNDLLTVFAQRQQLQQNPVAIAYHVEQRWLTLELLDRDPREPDSPGVWRIDPLLSPIEIPPEMSFVLRADGEEINIIDWPLTTTPVERRPHVTITLRDAEFSATIDLPPHAIVPRPPTTDSSAGREDLDDAGRSRERW